jgi:hypothetical protein
MFLGRETLATKARLIKKDNRRIVETTHFTNWGRPTVVGRKVQITPVWVAVVDQKYRKSLVSGNDHLKVVDCQRLKETHFASSPCFRLSTSSPT